MFDPKTQPPSTHFNPFNPLESKNETYTSLNFDAKPQKAAHNNETCNSWSTSVGGLQFSPEKVDDESGVCSPPLWVKNSPAKSPVNAKNYDKKLNSTSISPSSRVQAIARGQRELMEMVRGMPESSYELSLKDLVEYHSHRGVENQSVQNQDYLAQDKTTDCLVELDESLSKKASVRRQESGKKLDKKGKTLVRSGSNVNENKGVFLKMVFPVNLGGKKKKKKANPYTKVSQNKDEDCHSHVNLEDNKALVEKEWWKRRSSNSDESRISSNSGSTGSSSSSGSSVSCTSTRSISYARKKNGCLRGILPFHSRKSLSEK